MPYNVQNKAGGQPLIGKVIKIFRICDSPNSIWNTKIICLLSTVEGDGKRNTKLWKN